MPGAETRYFCIGLTPYNYHSQSNRVIEPQRYCVRGVTRALSARLIYMSFNKSSRIEQLCEVIL